MQSLEAFDQAALEADRGGGVVGLEVLIAADVVHGQRLVAAHHPQQDGPRAVRQVLPDKGILEIPSRGDPRRDRYLHHAQRAQVDVERPAPQGPGVVPLGQRRQEVLQAPEIALGFVDIHQGFAREADDQVEAGNPQVRVTLEVLQRLHGVDDPVALAGQLHHPAPLLKTELDACIQRIQ